MLEFSAIRRVRTEDAFKENYTARVRMHHFIEQFLQEETFSRIILTEFKCNFIDQFYTFVDIQGQSSSAALQSL
jgi:hypothetical protein